MAQAFAFAPAGAADRYRHIAAEPEGAVNPLIDVELLNAGEVPRFVVTVWQRGESSTHEVSIGAEARGLLPPCHPLDACVLAAFRFLLSRSSGNPILRRFDLSVLARHFPDFERELPEYLYRG